MEPENALTVCIVRRMKRWSLSRWPWKRYDPRKGLPEELEFDVLDANERKIGVIAYSRPRIIKEKNHLATPWGLADAGFGYWRGGFRISINGQDFVEIAEHYFPSRMELNFHSGTRIVLTPKKGVWNELEFLGEAGFFEVSEEFGTLPVGAPTQLRLAHDEILMMPKNQRPKSIETNEYRQFRMSSHGVLPAKVEDAIAALAIFKSYMCLYDEVPR